MQSYWHWFEKEWTRMSWIEVTPHLQWIQFRSNPGGRKKPERAHSRHGATLDLHQLSRP
jgi:hypothetical protein